MAAKTKERAQGFDLFINTSLTLKEIAAMISVSQKQIGKWAEEDSWEILRTGKQNTSGRMIAAWYKQLQLINEDIETRGGIPTTADTDKMCKIAENIQKLSKKQNLSMYHQVLLEFLQDLMINHNESAKLFGPLMLEFMKQKAQKLANDI